MLLVAVVGAGVFAFARHFTLRDAAVERVRGLPPLIAVGRLVPVRVDLNVFTNRVEVGLEVKWAAKPKELFADVMRQVPDAVPFEAWPGMIAKELERFTLEQDDWYARAIPYRVVLVQP